MKIGWVVVLLAVVGFVYGGEPPRFVDMQRAAPDTVDLFWFSEAEQWQRIDATPSLSTGEWCTVHVGPVTVGTNQWTDTQIADLDSRFYRLVTEDLEQGANMAGFLRFEMREGGKTTLGYPFLPFDPGQPPNLAYILGEQLPVGSVALVWDQVGAWAGGVKASRSGWWPPEVGLMPGDGAQLYAPERGQGSVSVLLMGEVPVAEVQPGDPCPAPLITAPFLSHPYPEPLLFAEMEQVLGPLAGGSTFFAWDPEEQIYLGFTKSARAGWPGAALSFVIDPGTAVWVSEPGGAWSPCLAYERPFDWPTVVLPSSSEGVEIVGMGLTEEGVEIQWVAPSDLCVFGLEGSPQLLVPEWMPLTAAQRLLPGTNVWTDAGTEGVPMRIYRASGMVLP